MFVKLNRDLNMNRKDFFKNIAHTITDSVAQKIDKVNSFVEDEPQLSEEKKSFLTNYTQWLTEFQVFVLKRNESPFNIENNKKLMALSADADKRKVELEKNMTDPIFSDCFNRITKEVSDIIS